MSLRQSAVPVTGTEGRPPVFLKPLSDVEIEWTPLHAILALTFLDGSTLAKSLFQLIGAVKEKIERIH